MADTQLNGNEADDIIKQIDFDAIDIQKVSNFFACSWLKTPARERGFIAEMVCVRDRVKIPCTPVVTGRLRCVMV
jgi:hypothetical protein